MAGRGAPREFDQLVALESAPSSWGQFELTQPRRATAGAPSTVTLRSGVPRTPHHAVPGDVIFYQYPGFSNINHSAVVTGTQPATGELWMTQQDKDYYDTSLTDQQARIKADTSGYASICVRHVTM